ncbi:MAG: GGDEF domain-containing protein [Chloroflexia bacterium]|nr:GGDEF domain-containing protein [Chloroflexia bacterium]
MVHRRSFYDPLTGLLNQAALPVRLKRALQQAGQQGQKVAVLVIGLGDLEQTRDTLGSETVDQLLQAVAGRLKLLVRGEDIIARAEADRFVILLLDVANREATAKVAERILQKIGQSFYQFVHPIDLNVSIGISLYPEHSQDSTTLLEQAEEALEQVQPEETARYRIYS